MLQLRKNTQKIWYSTLSLSEDEVDENGDFTGHKVTKYSKPVMKRVNLSPARGTAETDIFGSNLRYSKTLSTSHMNLAIDERTLIWDEEPELDAEERPDPLTAKYRVVGIARGHYHVHYALRQMNPTEDKE